MLFDLSELRPMHLIYFIEALVDLLDSDDTLILLINNSEDRLVFLFINSELLLHLERGRG